MQEEGLPTFIAVLAGAAIISGVVIAAGIIAAILVIVLTAA